MSDWPLYLNIVFNAYIIFKRINVHLSKKYSLFLCDVNQLSITQFSGDRFFGLWKSFSFINYIVLFYPFFFDKWCF